MPVIGGLQKSSLLDYPGKISAIVFMQGCNFRCGFCHNPELISIKQSGISVSDCLNFLETRRGKLDAVVITGGEPCLQSGLKDFIRKIKAMDFLVKLDTNGSFPSVLEELLRENLLDYIAMDIKAPFEKYTALAGMPVDTEKIRESISIIMNSGIDYEFRTTVVREQLTHDDIIQTSRQIAGAEKYYLQKFIPSKILNPALQTAGTYSDSEFEVIIQNIRSYVKNSALRIS
ncbi:MAG: anaerobic ribonucleoside-triphosphate reductase activating protein [Heliobacteriaceae bacterium]|jgi:pyruvate formate lyase activating enzyme|nr:anaerobic ribonucleoside-triphosphate reductase activating protein [Heliobacteriaceae bacterium]